MVDAPGAELLVQVHDGLGIASGAQAVPPLNEHPAQLLVVINLAVEHNPDRSVLVADRLLTAPEVDDAQPTHTQSDTGAEVNTLFIGPAVHQHLAHPADFVFEHRLAVKANDSSNATHVRDSGGETVEGKGEIKN